MEKYRASIKTIEEDYYEIIKRFDHVKIMLSELKELAVKAKEAAAESEEVFGSAGNLRPVINGEIIKSLEEWLQVLENKLSEGSLKAVKVGLSKLEQECSEKLEKERDNYSYNFRAYNEWLDLKGQFKALIAKSEVLRSKGLLVDGSLDVLIEKTHAALYGNPVDLDICRQLVRKLGVSL
jgi:hypothetical protein